MMPTNDSQLYMSEIFPTRIREGGVAVGAASQWLFNFTFSQITPHAINNLGWKTFLMFAIFNWALVFYTWFFIKEVRLLFACLRCFLLTIILQTKGRSLEEMELGEYFYNDGCACPANKVQFSTRNIPKSIFRLRITRRLECTWRNPRCRV
jgi:hypothetical protein